MPLMRGGESDWVRRMVGTPQQPRGVNAVLGAPVMTYVVKADPAFDVLTFDPERDMAALTGGLAGEHVHQPKTDIAAFVNRAGSSCSGTASTIQAQARSRPSSISKACRRRYRRQRTPCGFSWRRGCSTAAAARTRSLRRAHGARGLGRAGDAAGIDAGDQGRLAAVAADLSVSTAAAVYRHRRHERRGQLHLRGAVSARVGSRKPGAGSPEPFLLTPLKATDRAPINALVDSCK